jgi:cytosine/adenosine deaminase-related metal-dependent hydrolase
MLLAYPVLGLSPLPPDLIRLRSLLLAVESLKGGVTCLLDDVVELPSQNLDAIDAVFGAYDEAGIRANCSGNVADRPFAQWMPFAHEFLDPTALSELLAAPQPSVEHYLEFSREVLSRHHGSANGRLRYVISPSGPQRCTDGLMIAAEDLSKQWQTTYHIHVLETRLQALTGQEHYGRTLVRHLEQLGVLNDRAVLAHGIWLTEPDIECLAEAGVTVAHNPVSNLKLGSGIAPWRALHSAGVCVALGSDGISSNDTGRMFDVMKFAALLQTMDGPDYRTWATATEVLWAATRGGARAVRLEGQIGAVSPQHKADLIVIRTDTVNFTPTNVIENHLVYCENGDSIEEVIVDGKTVVSAGKVLTVDEEALISAVQQRLPEILLRHGEIERSNQVFRKWTDKAYEVAWQTDVGAERTRWRPKT